jgi:hypothetical protein
MLRCACRLPRCRGCLEPCLLRRQQRLPARLGRLQSPRPLLPAAKGPARVGGRPSGRASLQLPLRVTPPRARCRRPPRRGRRPPQASALASACAATSADPASAATTVVTAGTQSVLRDRPRRRRRCPQAVSSAAPRRIARRPCGRQRLACLAQRACAAGRSATRPCPDLPELPRRREVATTAMQMRRRHQRRWQTLLSWNTIGRRPWMRRKQRHHCRRCIHSRSLLTGLLAEPLRMARHRPPQPQPRRRPRRLLLRPDPPRRCFGCR